MQLILAIDSDARQSDLLAKLVNARLSVELVQATSAGEGLHALKDRVPDLILTSPLLSPFDDGVLDEYLRELGAAAAHVQTLRIPFLNAMPKRRSAASRLFSLGRSKKQTSSATPDGCDPKVFADEITLYLSRAADARQSMPQLAQAWAARQDEPPLSPVVANPVIANPVGAYPAVMSEELIDEFADAIHRQQHQEFDVRHHEVVAHAREPQYVQPAPAQPAHRVAIEPAHVEPTDSSDVARARDDMRNSAPDVQDVMQHAEQMTRARATSEPSDAAPMATSEPNHAAPRSSSTFEAALAAIRAAWVKPEESETATSLTSIVPTPGSSSYGEVAPHSHSISPAPHEVDTPKSGPENGRVREMGASERRPKQDEFGVFDPDQCGFPALVDRLDEVAESKEPPHRAAGTSRVISIR